MGADEIPKIKVAGPPHSVFDADLLGCLASDLFPRFLERQRWFGAKSRNTVEIQVADMITLALEPVPLVVVLLQVRFSEGPEETYQLVLGVRDVPDEAAAEETVARLVCQETEALLYDALSDPSACRLMLELIAAQTDVAGYTGRILMRRTACLRAEPFALSSIQPLDLEQSNSSVLFGESLFLKVFRKIEFGLNPDLELNLFLTREAGFQRVPELCGAITYIGPDTSATLAFVQEYIPSEGSGWDEALKAVKEYLDDPGREKLYAFEKSAHEIGLMLGELHLALASEGQDPAFSPEPVTASDVAQWRATVLERLEQARSSHQEHEENIVRIQAKIEAAFDALGSSESLGLKMRYHGDYHLNQVLRTPKGWIMLDFEGEPNRPLEERRRKHTPLRDVAVMLGSFNYAAYTALSERARPGGDQWKRQQSRVNEWEAMARQAFLQGYVRAMGDSRILPDRAEIRRKILKIFELDRIVCEINYDLDNRPEWAEISLQRIEPVLNQDRAEADGKGAG